MTDLTTAECLAFLQVRRNQITITLSDIAEEMKAASASPKRS